MSISAYRSHWIWTPLVGWALLSCGMTPAWAQAPVPGATADPGTGSATTTSTTGTPSADVRSIVPGADIPAIDPTTGLPIVNDFNTPGSSTTGGTGVRSAVTPTTAVQPASTLPAVIPQTNTGSSITGPSVTSATTAAPVANEVTSLPSFATTILNAPFGASVSAPVVDGGGGQTEVSELGITIGSFRLYPSIEINVGSDSNVFALSPSAGPVGSLYTSIAPALDLRSDWLNHALHVGISGASGNYATASTQNYTNYALVADGRIDIHTDFFVTWSAAYQQSTEPLGSPNATGATGPTIVNTIPLKLGISQHIGRFFYEATGTAAHYGYVDNQVVSTAELSAAERERYEYGETFRFGYDVAEDLSIFLQPSFNQVNYVQDTSRNATGQSWNVGTSWKPSLSTTLEATVGLMSMDSVSTGSTSGLTYGLSGTWNGYQPLTLRPSVSRATTQTALVNFTSAVSTTYALDYNYLIHDAWTAVGGMSITTSDYLPSAATNSTAIPRTDYFVRFQMGLLYTIRPQIQIGPFFEYDTATTTDPVNGPMYDREIFSVRLIARR